MFFWIEKLNKIPKIHFITKYYICVGKIYSFCYKINPKKYCFVIELHRHYLFVNKSKLPYFLFIPENASYLPIGIKAMILQATGTAKYCLLLIREDKVTVIKFILIGRQITPSPYLMWHNRSDLNYLQL